MSRFFFFFCVRAHKIHSPVVMSFGGAAVSSKCADVSSCGRKFFGRAAAAALAMRTAHPDMTPVWHPMSESYITHLGGRWRPWRFRNSRLLVDGIPFMNASDIAFASSLDGPSGHADAVEAESTHPDSWWAQAAANGSHASKGFPVDVFGHPVQNRFMWDPFMMKFGTASVDVNSQSVRKHVQHSQVFISLADISALDLSVVNRTSMDNVDPSSMIPVDAVRHVAAVLDRVGQVSPPQIFTLQGHVLKISSVALALRLHEVSPTNNLWFEVPASVVEGGGSAVEGDSFATFPFNLKSGENVLVLDISELSIKNADSDVRYVMPLSSIEEIDHRKATFFHENVAVSLRGLRLQGEASLGAATLALQESYDSAVWVSEQAIHAFGLVAKGQELLGISSSSKEGSTTFVNIDVLEPLSDGQWLETRRQFQRAFGYRTTLVKTAISAAGEPS